MQDYKHHTNAHEGKYELVKDAVTTKPKLISSRDDSGRHLLHWACVGGHADIVEFLIDSGAELDAQDETGWTPIMCAACAGHLEVLRMLVGRGANHSVVNNGGHSPLQYAASKNHPEIVVYLLSAGADVNIRDVRGATALHRAASQGHIRTVEELLKQDECKLNLQNSEGNTPLHLACEEERTECAKLLLNRGADQDIVNKEGLTPKQVIPEPLPKNHIPGHGSFYPSK